MDYVVAANRIWVNNFRGELNQSPWKFSVIDNKEQLTFDYLKKLNPKYVFFPHWSYIIPEVIYSNFTCVIFHMTDLPFGRGGSPLQNLIVRGFNETKISAIRCVKEIDAGPIYLKRSLSLEGRAQDIYKRAGKIIFEMINEVISKPVESVNQVGEVVKFNRRSPQQSDIQDLDSIQQVYDYIRMLDADGYPKAFLETKGFRFEFSQVLREGETLRASVLIKEKGSE